MKTVELEVRCCCTPTRLYGYLPVRAASVKAGALLTFQLSDGGALQLPVEKFTDGSCFSKQFYDAVASGDTSRFAKLTRIARRLALKFEGDDMTPQEKVELLRKVTGFREAREHRQ
jgi:hypothetical protein